MNDENPFPSVSHMCEALKIPESRFAQGWRLVSAVQGQITALPRSRGKVVATDGLMCLILTEDGGFYFGHYSWFMPDKTDKTEGGTKTRVSRRQTLLPDFVV